MRKFSSLKEAFKSVYLTEDAMLQASEFQELLKNCGFDFELRFVRALYLNGVKEAEEKLKILQINERKKDGGSMSYFMLRMLLLRSTFTRLRGAFSHLEISCANQRQIKRLAVDRLVFSTARGRIWIAFKFQAKLSANMVKEFITKLATASNANIVSVVSQMPGFFSYDFRMFAALTGMLRLLGNPLNASSGDISLREFIVSTILLSDAVRNEDKFQIIFGLFDGDSDGCFSKRELVEMQVSLARLRTVATFDQSRIKAEAALSLATLQGERCANEICRRLNIQEENSSVLNITRRELFDVVDLVEDFFPILHSLVPLAEWANTELSGALSAPASVLTTMQADEAKQRMRFYVNRVHPGAAWKQADSPAVELDSEREESLKKKPLTAFELGAVAVEETLVIRLDERHIDFGGESEILPSGLVAVAQDCIVCNDRHNFLVRSDPMG